MPAVALAEHGQPHGQAILPGLYVLLDPAVMGEMIEQPLGRAFRCIEVQRNISQADAAGPIGHDRHELQAVGQLGLDDAHLVEQCSINKSTRTLPVGLRSVN